MFYVGVFWWMDALIKMAWTFPCVIYPNGLIVLNRHLLSRPTSWNISMGNLLANNSKLSYSCLSEKVRARTYFSYVTRKYNKRIWLQWFSPERENSKALVYICSLKLKQKAIKVIFDFINLASFCFTDKACSLKTGLVVCLWWANKIKENWDILSYWLSNTFLWSKMILIFRIILLSSWRKPGCICILSSHHFISASMIHFNRRGVLLGKRMSFKTMLNSVNESELKKSFKILKRRVHDLFFLLVRIKRRERN